MLLRFLKDVGTFLFHLIVCSVTFLFCVCEYWKECETFHLTFIALAYICTHLPTSLILSSISANSKPLS